MMTPAVAATRPEQAIPASLSGRELEVQRLAASGFTYYGIAHALGISERTVKVYVTRAFGRLGVDNRADAWRALGWLVIP